MNAVLQSLVGDVDTFLRERWSREPVRTRATLPALITGQEIADTVDCGLLSLPYFAVLRGGVPVAPDEVATSRTVLAASVPGFAHRTNLLGHVAHGATVELRQVHDWHPAIRDLVEGLRPAFDAEIGASVYLAERGAAAIRAEDGGAHTFVAQVAGCSEWTLGAWDVLDEQVPLRAGEVLYVPGGWSYRATVVEGPSLLVAVTVAEPTVADVVDAVVADLTLRLRSEPTGSLPRAEDRAAGVRDEVIRYCADADVTALAAAVVRRG